MEFTVDALNMKTAGVLVLLGAAPLVAAAALLMVLTHDKSNHLVAVGVLALAGVITGLGLWQLWSIRVHVDDNTLHVGGGVYRLSVPKNAIALDSVQHRDPDAATQQLGLRTNGIGMPGLALGWFRARSGGGRIFAAVTDPERVVVIPTTSGYTVLVSPDDPQALLDALSSK